MNNYIKHDARLMHYMVEAMLESDDPMLKSEAFAVANPEERRQIATRLTREAIRRRDVADGKTPAGVPALRYIRTPSPYPEIDARNEKALSTLIDELKETEGDNLLYVWLYGSVARGDCRDRSDINVFILLRDEGNSQQSIYARILTITVDIMLNESKGKVLINTHSGTLEDYKNGLCRDAMAPLEQEGYIIYDSGFDIGEPGRMSFTWDKKITMDHSEFERKVMEKLLDSPEKPYCILKRQYENSMITSRKFTGVGFFTSFEVPEELIVPGMRGQIQDVCATFDDPDLLYLFVLFVKNGKIDCLEGFTASGDWINDYSKATLCYAFEGERRHEIVNSSDRL